MPLYIIKHLKAPWPTGAVTGDVIEFEVLPGWAAGKCELGGAQATVFAAQAVEGDGSGEALAAADEQARRELSDRVVAAEQALAAALADLEASLGREAALQGQLSEVQAALAVAKDETKSEAKAKK